MNIGSYFWDCIVILLGFVSLTFVFIQVKWDFYDWELILNLMFELIKLIFELFLFDGIRKGKLVYVF